MSVNGNWDLDRLNWNRFASAGCHFVERIAFVKGLAEIGPDTLHIFMEAARQGDIPSVDPYRIGCAASETKATLAR